MLQLLILLCLWLPISARADSIVLLKISDPCKDSFRLQTPSNPGMIAHFLADNVALSQEEPPHLLRQALETYESENQKQITTQTRDSGELPPYSGPSIPVMKQDWTEIAGLIHQARQIPDGVIIVKLTGLSPLPPTSNYFADIVRYWIGSPADFVQLPPATIQQLSPQNLQVASFSERFKVLNLIDSVQTDMQSLARGGEVRIHKAAEAQLMIKVVAHWENLIRNRLDEAQEIFPKVENLPVNHEGLRLPDDVLTGLSEKEKAEFVNLWQLGSETGRFFDLSYMTNAGYPRFLNNEEFLKLAKRIAPKVNASDRDLINLIRYTSVRDRQDVAGDYKTEQVVYTQVLQSLKELKEEIEKAAQFLTR